MYKLACITFKVGGIITSVITSPPLLLHRLITSPFSDEVQKEYDLSKERVQDANYKRDLEIARLKRSL
ncbi:hypothetical protein AN214_01496 [Pseudoalteromonas sp. P1-9]|nr:hypothetical protein AN214_01496 [Pseudoalteromonas sp. P1-9]